MSLFQASQHSATISVGLEYPVGKPVIAHELPYVFDGVQLGRSWFGKNQCDVGWDLEPAGGVPSGPVDDEYSGAISSFAECCSGAGQGPHGTEDIGRLRALVPERRGSAAASRPRRVSILADPGLILPPDFYRVGREPARIWQVFLKSSTANSFCPLWRGRADHLAKPHRPQFTRLINRNSIEYPMRQVLSAPTATP